MGEKKRILLAEDHTIVREGLQALLVSTGEFEIVAEAKDGLEAVRCVQNSKPDLVLLDLAMPLLGGIDAIKEIKKQSPAQKILVLTVHKSQEYVLAAFRSGADGYCLKDATYDELLTAIRSIFAGMPYISPGIAGKILEGYLEKNKSLPVNSPWDTLTPREKAILKLIGEGHKNKEIAELLCISLNTVEKHRSNLMQKLDLHSGSALTAYAIEKGLVNR